MNYAMYFLLSELRRQSVCQDKQVACVITDKEDNILSVGVNTVNECKKCDVGNTNAICDTIHAEEAAIQNLAKHNESFAYRAYISLYPCPVCQRRLDNYVKEIVVFNKQHKPLVIDKEKIIEVGDLAAELSKINGSQKQVSVITGELAELITSMADYFYRRHEREIDVSDILFEIIDVELMIQCLVAILKENGNDYELSIYNLLKSEKLHRIADKLQSGAIRGGSPFDNPLYKKGLY